MLGGTSYQVVRELGAGGMGVVYEVEHVRLKKRYVAKTMHERIAHDASAQKRLEREAQVLAAIEHPNIVRVHDFGITPDGITYVIMEKLTGCDLRTFLRTSRITAKRAAEISIDILAALDHVHREGIVHRDIKPDNVYLAEVVHSGVQRTVTKVLDFGIAHLFHTDSELSKDRLTKTGGFVGTLYYAAPEQMQGHRAVPATDVYSASLVLFELLAGRGPFDDDEGVGLVRCFNQAPRLDAFVAASPRLVAAVARGLEMAPDKRISARDLLRELEAILPELPATALAPVDAELAEADDLLAGMARRDDFDRPPRRRTPDAPQPSLDFGPVPPQARTPPGPHPPLHHPPAVVHAHAPNVHASPAQAIPPTAASPSPYDAPHAPHGTMPPTAALPPQSIPPTAASPQGAHGTPPYASPHVLRPPSDGGVESAFLPPDAHEPTRAAMNLPSSPPPAPSGASGTNPMNASGVSAPARAISQIEPLHHQPHASIDGVHLFGDPALQRKKRGVAILSVATVVVTALAIGGVFLYARRDKPDTSTTSAARADAPAPSTITSTTTTGAAASAAPSSPPGANANTAEATSTAPTAGATSAAAPATAASIANARVGAAPAHGGGARTPHGSPAHAPAPPTTPATPPTPVTPTKPADAKPPAKPGASSDYMREL